MKNYHLRATQRLDPKSATKEDAFRHLSETRQYLKGYFDEVQIENSILTNEEFRRLLTLTERKCQRCNGRFVVEYEQDKFCSKECLQNTFRWSVLNRDNFQCQYCGATPTNDGIKLHVDHIKPKIDGGSDDMNNLTTACSECNTRKSKYYLRDELKFKSRLGLIQLR